MADDGQSTHADSRPRHAEAPQAPETALWNVLLGAPPEGLAVWVLISTTGMGRTWVYEGLREWSDAGRIVQVRHGQWRAAWPGEGHVL